MPKAIPYFETGSAQKQPEHTDEDLMCATSGCRVGRQCVPTVGVLRVTVGFRSHARCIPHGLLTCNKPNVVVITVNIVSPSNSV